MKVIFREGTVRTILVLVLLGSSFGQIASHQRALHRAWHARAEFQRTHPCPATGKSDPCPGYVIEYIVPLACGGADKPSNMHWQKTAKKDRFTTCGVIAPNPASPEPVRGLSALKPIVENMERAQSAISIPNHVVRDYQLSRPGSAKVDSDVIAEVDFRAPGKYTVKKRSGSSVGEQVVKRILEHEVAIAVSSQKSRSAAVTQENYVFSYLGETVLDGQSYYLLHLDPKRKQPELISGQAWVDKHSFLIRRIEGGVKSPSWWVKKIHVRFDFASPRGMWVLSSMEAVADVRYLGARKLTSHVLDYDTSVVATK
jgi:hypothetical protein